MNEEMRKKLAEINATKAEVRQLIADGKLDEAESKKAELDALQRAFNLLLSMEDEDEAAAKAQAKKKQELHDEKQPPLTFARIGQAVVNALGAAVSRRKMDDTDRQIIQDAMKENSDPDGGLTVPQDIQTRIKELRRSDDNLEQYVNVEPVKTMSGSRVIEKEADTTAVCENRLHDHQKGRQNAVFSGAAGRHRREHPGLSDEVDRQKDPRNPQR